MDIRSEVGNVEHLKQISNITNVVVYNLSKKKTLYSELESQFSNLVDIKLGSHTSIPIYGYRPIVYALLATAYHLKTQKLKMGTVFIHAGIFILLNQVDMLKKMQLANPQKWQEYTEAKRNYQLALGLEKVSIWKYFRSFFADRLNKSDYLQILKLRPH